MESLVLPADIDNGHIGPTDPQLQNDSAVVSASFSNLNCLSSFRNYQKKKKKKKKIRNTISGISKGASTAIFALIFSSQVVYLLFALRSDDKTALAI